VLITTGGDVPLSASYICVALLLMGPDQFPEGYGIWLRIIVCCFFVSAAIIAHERNYDVLTLLFLFISILFNPVFKLDMPKDVWAMVDIGAGILLLSTAKSLRRLKAVPLDKP